MYRTRATPLRSAATELVKMAQMAEHLSDADLLAKVTIIHRKPSGMVDRRLLEKCRRIGKKPVALSRRGLAARLGGGEGIGAWRRCEVQTGG